MIVSLSGFAYGKVLGVRTEDFWDLRYDRGLLSYGLMATLYFGASLASLGIGLYVIKETLHPKPWLRRAMTLLAIAFAIGVIFHFFQNPPYSLRCQQTDVWSQLVCKTIGDNWVISLHLWLDALGIALAIFFALITSMVLRSESTASDDTEHLKERVRYLRMMLFVGSALLILATLRLRTMLHWTVDFLRPLPSVADNKDVSFLIINLDGVIANVVTIMGAFYTLVLAAIFVPAVLILINQAKKSGELVSPLSEQLLRLAAIIGPLLAGPVGELLSRLK